MAGIVNVIWRTTLLGDTFAFMPCLKAYAIKHNVVLNMVGANSFLALFPQETWWKRGMMVPGEPSIVMEVSTIHRKIGLVNGCLHTIDVNQAIRIEMIVPGQKVFERYAVIAPSASTPVKELSDPAIWQGVIDALDLPVIVVGESKRLWKNCHYVNCDTPHKLLNIVGHADLVIGLSSGISWLADACNRDIIRINGHADGELEFAPLFQLEHKGGCRHCWNMGSDAKTCSSMACMDFTAFQILECHKRWKMIDQVVPYARSCDDTFLTSWYRSINTRYEFVCGIDKHTTDLAMLTRLNRDNGKDWKYDDFDYLLDHM